MHLCERDRGWSRRRGGGRDGGEDIEGEKERESRVNIVDHNVFICV